MFQRLATKHDLTPFTTAATLTLFAFFAVFLFYPIAYMFQHAFWVEGRVSLAFFKLIVTNPVTRASVVNSLVIGLTTTVVTTLLALPLAFCMVKFEFRGKGLLSGLLLVPMIMPPFVGAIGIKQVLARYGSLNLLLMKLGVISAPIDWLGDGGFCGIVAL
ncbi:MAG: iron ABC transporter permease, partial [Planctomycetes bacterium]|nr:iron ABC transporter permease [Planctomycetota bacterium]